MHSINEMVIFRGDLCHAGAGYLYCNTRLHAYLDPLKWPMNVRFFTCEEEQ